MNKRVRMLAFLLALLMMCGTLVGALGMVANAADDDGNDVYNVSITNFSRVSGRGTITKGTVVDVSITYKHKNTNFTSDNKNDFVSLASNSIKFGNGMTTSGNTTMTITVRGVDDNGTADMQINIFNAVYNGPPRTISNGETIQTNIGGESYTLQKNDISIGIPAGFFESTSSILDDDDDDDNPYTSSTVIENIYFTDSTGVRIDQVDSDSPPFNLVVVYVDYGLREVDTDKIKDGTLEVFLVNTAGFHSGSGNRGALTYVNSSNSEAPRFQARFQNVTFTGDSNAVSLQIQYNIDGWEVSGEVTGNAHQAKDDDKDKLDPLTPHIIVNQYSYGTEQINAGNNFTLNMSVINTSPDIPLENIIMTIQPYIPENNTSSTTGGLTITSSSNTLYIPSLAVGESYSHSIDLRAEPSAAVGSHRLEVEFSFQYVDEVNKERKPSTDKESISIPVSQVDRFSVDPLTEYPDFMSEGDSDYITLSFVNKGKSITYNISGILTSNMLTMPQNVHFGNLEAGASDSLDFEVIATEAGEMVGEITLQYEDENADLNEILIPFTIQVEPAFDPWGEDPWGGGEVWEDPEPEGTPLATIIWCSVGGVLIALPIGLYLFKRVKAKGIEDFDEDF